MLFLLCAPAGASGTHAAAVAAPTRQKTLRYLEGRLQRLERTTWHWQRLTGKPLTQTGGRALAQLAVADLEQTLSRWQQRARAAHRAALHPPHLADWMCIHHYEGGWNDTGGPYWGGLQMSLTFQERYGAWLYRTKGTADHWTPLEQIWTAEKALRSRGFWPWPNTARMCGLI